MNNVQMKVEGDKLHITIDLTAQGHTSGSGKSTIIASTEGNATVPGVAGGVKLGLNLYKPLH